MSAARPITRGEHLVFPHQDAYLWLWHRPSSKWCRHIDAADTSFWDCQEEFIHYHPDQPEAPEPIHRTALPEHQTLSKHDRPTMPILGGDNNARIREKPRVEPPAIPSKPASRAAPDTFHLLSKVRNNYSRLDCDRERSHTMTQFIRELEHGDSTETVLKKLFHAIEQSIGF